jgi:hypothetical protein
MALQWGQDSAAMVVLHMLFADDTLIFCKASCEHLHNLRCLLFCFEALSGLKINLSKSEIIPIGEVDDVESLARIIGCRVALLQMKYLGLPLDAPSTSIWNDIVEKRNRWLADWKMLYLSKGGRLTLIISTLSNVGHILFIVVSYSNGCG